MQTVYFVNIKNRRAAHRFESVCIKTLLYHSRTIFRILRIIFGIIIKNIYGKLVFTLCIRYFVFLAGIQNKHTHMHTHTYTVNASSSVKMSVYKLLFSFLQISIMNKFHLQLFEFRSKSH